MPEAGPAAGWGWSLLPLLSPPRRRRPTSPSSSSLLRIIILVHPSRPPPSSSSSSSPPPPQSQLILRNALAALNKRVGIAGGDRPPHYLACGSSRAYRAGKPHPAVQRSSASGRRGTRLENKEADGGAPVASLRAEITPLRVRLRPPPTSGKEIGRAAVGYLVHVLIAAPGPTATQFLGVSARRTSGHCR